MKRRLFSILLTLALCLGLLPMGAVEVHAAEAYDLWIGGVQVTSENLAGTGWSYEPDTNTLTLNGATITAADMNNPSGYSTAIYSGIESLILEIIGTNTISNGTNLFSNNAYAIYTTGSLTIRGSGSLSANAGNTSQVSAGIRCEKVLTIESGTVKGVGGVSGDANEKNSYGIYAGSKLIVNGGQVNGNGANLSIPTGDTFRHRSYGIYVHAASYGEGITVSGGSLTGSGGTGTTSYGIYSERDITIQDGTVDATSGKAIVSVGMYAQLNLTISGGTVTAKTLCSDNEYDKYAINGTLGLSGVSAVASKTKTDGTDTEIYVSGNNRQYLYFNAVKAYDLYIAGTQVNSVNAADLSVIDGVTVASGGEAKYDDATKTLTLNGATITNSNANPGTVFASNIGVFYADSEDLKVSLTGKNTITTAPITVTGGNVYSTNSGFHSQGQGTAVMFTGGGSLDVRSGESIANSGGESVAISVAGPVTIDAATTISATADNASRRCQGFYAYGMITVNGSLTAVGGNSQSSYGIYGRNNMTVAGSAVVNATAGNATANNGAQSCAISCNEYDYGLLTVSGTSKVTATSSKTETGQSYGIFAKQVIAKDSAQIKAVAGESVKTASNVTALSRGIDSSTLEISDNAAVIAIGGKVVGTNTEGSIGVWLSKKGSISGGSLTATGTGGDGSEYTRGLMTPVSSNYGLYVSGGEVKLTAEKTAKYAFGFDGGDFSITGGTVTATAGATEPPTEAATVNSAGIYANGTIAVSNDDAVVNATGLLAGIYSMGGVTISGGTVTAEGIGDATITDHGYNGIGIRTDSPAKITFSGDKTEISAKGKKTGIYSPSGITISSPLTIVSPAGGKMSMGNMQIANADGSNATDVLIKVPEIYAITIGAGLNMSLDSGEESQSVVSGNAITDVVYTAEEGYYFPTNYSTAPVNGIGVTRNSFTQITVSGTPTAKTSFYPADATAKTKPAEPSVAATDCTTESNNDGTITGVNATMEYQKSGDTAWIAITGSEVEGLVPGTYSVRVAETDTTLSSDAVSVTIAEYNAPPKVNAPVFTPASGKTFTDTLDVTISIPDNATVYYTRDKSEPSETNGIMTTGAAITLEETTTLKAIAISNDPNYGNSDVVTATYTKSSPSTGGGGATTYPVTPAEAENGKITVSPKNAADGDKVTITVTPEEGYVLDKLTVKDKNGNEIAVKDNGDGTYTFTMPASAIEIEATFKPDAGAAADDFPFVDVPENSYFRKPVEWAVEKGITNGVSEDKYGPEMSCTRAQVVTFLWITCGSEDAGIETGFDDVDVSAYYDKAVAWAVEKGITAGTSENEFSPDVTVTRAQFVTMLWAAKGMPEAAGEMPFLDVPTDAYYSKAVAWAYANDITAGKSTDSFAPDDPCTRAQIMTFLYNAYAE